MDLNSEKNLEMAEVLLSALNPAARATLWLKVVKSQKEIPFFHIFNITNSKKTHLFFTQFCGHSWTM